MYVSIRIPSDLLQLLKKNLQKENSKHTGTFFPQNVKQAL